MRRMWLVAVLMLGSPVVGCGSGEVKAPPGAESSDTSLDVEMGNDSMGEGSSDAPADEPPADKKADGIEPATEKPADVTPPPDKPEDGK